MKIEKFNNSGSILIWSLMLGALLLTATFFFVLRLNSLSGVQIDTMNYQNQKAYLESYVEYIKSLDPLDLVAGPVHFDDNTIVGTVTNQVEAIEGVLDSGDSVDYTFAAVNVDIEWNLCSDGEDSDLAISPDPGPPATGSCGDYDSFVSSPGAGLITLTSLNAPLHYRITNPDPLDNGGLVTDKQWHINLFINLGYGKKIEVEEAFVP
ncbi:hypothetical protein KJ742_05275 [Patescibacteria group bacterium]|nr:hypothetical protein [Patescibacteria group bacterium]MBU1683329.1 hypothetical protein [Patescibacteria group bacterium]MBU1934681.1 hypothetical protein [Patescibacteria group bacterium]